MRLEVGGVGAVYQSFDLVNDPEASQSAACPGVPPRSIPARHLIVAAANAAPHHVGGLHVSSS